MTEPREGRIQSLVTALIMFLSLHRRDHSGPERNQHWRRAAACRRCAGARGAGGRLSPVRYLRYLRPLWVSTSPKIAGQGRGTVACLARPRFLHSHRVLFHPFATPAQLNSREVRPGSKGRARHGTAIVGNTHRLASEQGCHCNGLLTYF